MKFFPHWLTFAILFFVCGGLAQSPTVDAGLRQKTFEKVWKTIDEKFYDANFNGVDWKAVHDRYWLQAAASKTDDEFYFVLNAMLRELKVSHVGVIPPDQLTKLNRPASTTGLGLRILGGQVVVSRILPGSSAEQMNIKPGFVIKSVDDAEVKTTDDALVRLSGDAGSSVKVTYLDEKDALRNTTLRRIALNNNDRSELAKGIKIYALFTADRVADNIGYIRFSNFVEFLAPPILDAIDSFADAPGIIIDLRGNSGGDDNVALKMAGHLFDKETQLMVIKTRNSVNRSYKAKPDKHPYLGTVVILVDELSGSASEEFAAAMQDAGRAFIVGKTTLGEDLDADLVKLPTGAILIYPFGQPRTPRKGNVIDGRGVIPDKDVSLSRSALLAGHDSQLDAAVEYIKSRLQK